MYRIEQSGRMSLRRPKPPTKGGSAPEGEEEEEEEEKKKKKKNSYGSITHQEFINYLRKYQHLKEIFSRFFNYNQQDVTIFYLFLKGSTCFGRFLRPSSGARNCTFSFRYCQQILLEASSMIPACSSIG